MKKGRSLEILVASIERQLNDAPNVSVKSPGLLKSKINDQSREFDVVITVKQSHHDLLIALECKDWQKPVGVPEIEQYHSKCEAVNINKAVFVSSNGFAKTALSTAEYYDIKCIDLQDINSVDWLSDDVKVVVHTKKFITLRYRPLVDAVPDFQLDEFEIFDESDLLFSENLLKDNLKMDVDCFPYRCVGREVMHKITYRTKGFYLKCVKTDNRLPIKGFVCDVTYVCEDNESDFSKTSYRDCWNGTSIAEIATADILIEGESKKVTLINTEKGTSLKLISN